MPLADHVIAQVTFQRTTGLSEDVVTNTFHFRKNSGQAYAVAAANIRAALIAFYETNQAAGNGVGAWINSTISRVANASRVSTYDGSLPENLRVPTSSFWTLRTPQVSTPLPSEIAMCMSFRGNRTDVVRAIQRGRVYLGPLAEDSAAVGITGDLRVNDVLQSVIRQAATLHLRTNLTSATATWSVFSPTANILSPVEFVSTDNAYDIQRRRGVKASARTETAVPLA